MIAIASAVAIAPRVWASVGSNGRVARAIQTRAPQRITIGATEEDIGRRGVRLLLRAHERRRDHVPLL